MIALSLKIDTFFSSFAKLSIIYRGPTPLDFKSFEEMERDYILRVLEAKNWRIGGEDSAASTLGMHVSTLRGRMKKLGIKKPKP
jgi:transcriptional regulator with GAF, ATPase, and Fis domain